MKPDIAKYKLDDIVKCSHGHLTIIGSVVGVTVVNYYLITYTIEYGQKTIEVDEKNISEKMEV